MHSMDRLRRWATIVKADEPKAFALTRGLVNEHLGAEHVAKAGKRTVQIHIRACQREVVHENVGVGRSLTRRSCANTGGALLHTRSNKMWRQRGACHHHARHGAHARHHARLPIRVHHATSRPAVRIGGRASCAVSTITSARSSSSSVSRSSSAAGASAAGTSCAGTTISAERQLLTGSGRVSPWHHPHTHTHTHSHSHSPLTLKLLTLLLLLAHHLVAIRVCKLDSNGDGSTRQQKDVVVRGDGGRARSNAGKLDKSTPARHIDNKW